MAEHDQLALHFTEAIARYMQAKFHQQLEGSDEHVSFPSDWDLTLLQESDQVVEILVEAYHNTCLYHCYVLHICCTLPSLGHSIWTICSFHVDYIFIPYGLYTHSIWIPGGLLDTIHYRNGRCENKIILIHSNTIYFI